MYVFLITRTGGRTNICSDIEVLSKEKLIEHIKNSENKGYLAPKIRYCKVDEGITHLLSHMPLEEFNNVFSQSDFSENEITMFFRKEISNKYGLHSKKRIPKKDLEIGGIYRDEKDNYFLYFGKCSVWFMEKTEDSIGGPGCIGYTYYHINNKDINPIISGSMKLNDIFDYNSRYYLHIDEKCKKFIEKIGDINVDIPERNNFKFKDNNELYIKKFNS